MKEEFFKIEATQAMDVYWSCFSHLSGNAHNFIVMEKVAAEVIYRKNNRLKKFKLLSSTQGTDTEGRWFEIWALTSYYTDEEIKYLEFKSQLEYFISNLETA